MSKYDPATVKKTDYAEVFGKVLFGTLFFYPMILGVALTIFEPAGSWQGQQAYLSSYFGVQDRLLCAWHTSLQFTNTSSACDIIYGDMSISEGIYVRHMASAVLALILALLMGFKSTQRKDSLIHIRGNQRFDDKEAENLLAAHSQKEARKDKGDDCLVALPYMKLSKRRQGRHFASFGGTGGGKTQTMLSVMFPAYKRGDKMIIHDNKGDFTMWIPDALLLAPADKRSAIWDIGKDIDNIPAIREFANFMIPPGKGDPIWHLASQMMLTGFLLSLRDEFEEDWGWYQLAGILLLNSQDWLILLEKHFPEALDFVENPDSNLAIGLKAEIKAHFQLISDLANAWGINTKGREKIALKEWVLDDNPKHRVIILQFNAEIKSLSALWIGAVFNIITPRAIGNQRKKTFKVPIWFFMDELAELTKQEQLNSLINLGREKGIYVFIGCQTISSLYAKYSVEEVDN